MTEWCQRNGTTLIVRVLKELLSVVDRHLSHKAIV